MFGLSKKKPTLAEECRAYLEAGPPASMSSYVPGSITEMIIAQGAHGNALDEEMRELSGIVLMEAEFGSGGYENPEVAAYMERGFALVRRVVQQG